MKGHAIMAALLAMTATAMGTQAALASPLSLHPQNPHYFLFRGKPAVLITSGEHYGAVLNLDFDYRKYLDTLAADGLNLTRTFSGAYVEPPGAFAIASNTLAPKPGRFICPWARSDQPGYAGAGNKFDLTHWDDAYFARLKDFVAYAGQRGIVVEMNLFCPMYDDSQWAISPMNAVNNINGVGKVGKNEVYDLKKNDGLLLVQEALVRKIVNELRDADNVYYEICNEPYFGGVTMEWQHHIADVITATEQGWTGHHLISQNIANVSRKIEQPHPQVSIFNFHYAHPPTTVAENFGLNKVIGLNETGFHGTADDYYRMEAWEFILAGGGLYNNLDYSFTAGHEDGTFQYPATQPGGGGVTFRQQMKVLKDFLHSLDFLKLQPAPGFIHSGLPDKAQSQVLATPGQQYAMYLKGAANALLQLDLPAGNYHVARVDVLTGQTVQSYNLQHGGGHYSLPVPANFREVAVKIVRF